MLIDTHTHLYDEAFSADGEQLGDAVRRAVDAGVDRMILPGCELKDFEPMRLLRTEFPGTVYLAAGLHPENMPGGDPMEEVQAIAAEMRANPCEFVAVGEIGMDLYWDKSRLDDQQRVFDAQCRLANELGLPVIIHCREALDPTLEVLRGLPQIPAGVFHSFSGSLADLERVRATGDFYFGINGIVTFKKSTIPALLPAIPRDRLLLETDSPYLAPVPCRGRRNESAYLRHTAVFVASALDIPVEQLAETTTANALRLFPTIATAK